MTTRVIEGTDSLTTKYRLNKAMLDHADALKQDGYEKGIEKAIDVLVNGARQLGSEMRPADVVLQQAVKILEASKRGV
nr:MAG TPA: hypothetical protein [Caudoviricetes sp.]